MRSVLCILFTAFAVYVPSALAGDCELSFKDGRLELEMTSGTKECKPGQTLHGASTRSADVVLADMRFCEEPKAANVESVKNDGAFARRFHLRCTYSGFDSAPHGRTEASDVVSLRR